MDDTSLPKIPSSSASKIRVLQALLLDEVRKEKVIMILPFKNCVKKYFDFLEIIFFNLMNLIFFKRYKFIYSRYQYIQINT